MVKIYLNEIFKITQKGDAREESYYKPLSQLIEDYSASIKKKSISVTISPQRTEAGNPDFRIWDGKQSIIGYIEAKNINQSNLDKIEESEQLKRYLGAFENVILTNFFEFRLYRNAQLIDSVQIARPFIATQLKTVPPVENEKKFLTLLKDFLSFSIKKDYSPKTLAEALACRTHYLRKQVLLELQNKKSTLTGFYEAFQQFLIAGLSKEDFADMYAQTVTYGLFAASTRQDGTFTRKTAFDNIPATIGILRDVFRFISLEEPGEQLSWIIDDIADVLRVANAKKLLHKYYIEGRGSDPIVHFYETFLAQYDPDEREQRGVYYTPEDVVGYIVRSLNIILKECFEKPDGFACENVTVLDPAAGTLTFLAQTARTAVNEFSVNYGSGGRDQLIKKHILNNFYAFELMMAPYAIGHLKMGFLLEELGYKLQKDDRFKLYLTNTLELEELAQSTLPGMSSLSEESHAAALVKKEQPILVILGNPPYSGHSANKGKWISREIRKYYEVDGKPLDEKNPKWLQDDYVKFIRFAQWKIDTAGEGVLGFITNHSYLDNPTFRGMRQSLLNSFDSIYILDLHGNSKKKEKCPDGSIDKNVFDIQQGVAIILAVKKPGLEKQVLHANLWGLREDKYTWLKINNINTTKWKTISPKSPFYFFVPRDERQLSKYLKFPQVTDIFPVNSVGIVTSRDKFVIDANKEELKKRIRMFRDESLSDEMIKKAFDLKDKAKWKVKDARRKIRDEQDWEKFIQPILYRPFDTQWIFYHNAVIERKRKNVMTNLIKENFVLLCCRQQNKVGFWHALVADKIIESCIVSDRTREIGYAFPLYLYPSEDLYNGGINHERDVNIEKEFLGKLAKVYSPKSLPEKIFYYIYAILYSEKYRVRYAEFLKTDFPRIPFTADGEIFTKLAKFGKELVELHLLKSKKLEKSALKFEGTGNRKIEIIEYDSRKRLVKINEKQYFSPLPLNIWQYQIGGYQVMEKWLKDRKTKPLSLEDIKQYCKIATALKETIALQKKIDDYYNQIEKNLLDLTK